MNYGHVLFGRGIGGGIWRIAGVDPSPGTVVGDPDLLTVSDTAVNGHDGGVLAGSLRQGGEIALQLAHRTFRIWEPINVLEIEISDLGDCDAHGSSADLALGVATYLALAHRQKLDLSDVADFAATGTLDKDGRVGAVDSVAGKMRAALDAGFAAGSMLFYPSASQGQVDVELQSTCKARGVELVPVACIEDVLDKLGVRVERAWEGNPFRGLNAYTAEHGPVFFGREREVDEVVTRLEKRAADNKPGLLIIGASGSGKSSFCMAGVMPALQRQTPNLEWAVWRPRDAAKGGSGKEVDEAFFAARLQADTLCQGSGQNGFNLPDPPEGIASLAALADMLVPNPGVRRVLVVDQFEELFTLGFTLDVQRAFARFLQRLQEAGIWVIGTLRSEFYLAYTDLRDETNNALLARVFDQDGRYDLLHMGDEALRRVITGPAHMARLRFEGASGQHATSLDDRILTAALKTSDTLPLLSFILDRLYEDLDKRTEAAVASGKRVERDLAHAAYDAEGCLHGAIGKRAAGAFARLGQDAQDALKEVLDALAVPSSDGKRETARPALRDQWPDGSPARKLIEALVAPDVRVLITERESDGLNRPRVRVAHEALFTHWEEAAAVLAKSRDNRAIIEDFRRRSAAWETATDRKAALLRGGQDIANARVVRPLLPATADNEALIAFLNQSLKRSSLRWRAMVSGVVSTILLLSVALAFAVTGQRQARAAALQAGKLQIFAMSERGRALKAEQSAKSALVEVTKQKGLADIGRIAAEAAQKEQSRQTVIAQQRAHEAEMARADAAKQLGITTQRTAELERALKAIHASSSTLVSDLAAGTKHWSGVSSGLRIRFLIRAQNLLLATLSAYPKHLEGNEQYLSLIRELAITYSEMSDAYLSSENTKLAISSLENAESMFKSLLSKRQTDDIIRDLQIILRKKSDISYRSENYDDAFTFAKEGLDSAIEMNKISPKAQWYASESESRLRLARIYDIRGKNSEQINQLFLAMNAMRSADKLENSLYSKFQLSAAIYNYSSSIDRKMHSSDRINLLEEVNSIYHDFYQKYPSASDNIKIQSAAIYYKFDLGQIYCSTGKTDSGEKLLKESFDIAIKLSMYPNVKQSIFLERAARSSLELSLCYISGTNLKSAEYFANEAGRLSSLILKISKDDIDVMRLNLLSHAILRSLSNRYEATLNDDRRFIEMSDITIEQKSSFYSMLNTKFKK